MESLQKFPIEVTRQPPSPIVSTFTPMPIPPYPQTPQGELPDGQTAFPFGSNYNQENIVLVLIPIDPISILARQDQSHSRHDSQPSHLRPPHLLVICSKAIQRGIPKH